MASGNYVNPEQRVYGFAHLWGELIAHMIDDKKVPFVEISHERDEQYRRDITGLKNEEGQWFHVALDSHRLEQMVHEKDATLVAAVYELYKDTFVDLLAESGYWPGHKIWIENWEFAAGLRRDRPESQKQLKRRRVRIRRD
jgi:hypothetical protein